MSEEKIPQLRASVKARIQSENPNFHPGDVSRLDDDSYLKRFLMHHDNDPKAAEKMIFDAFTFRRNIGACDINESNVNMDYINEGAFFPNGRDIDGKLLLVFKCRLHTKGCKDYDELKKCIVYWFDRIERMEKGRPITLFFDMESCGLSNMDMEFTKYLISLVKDYYPYMLNYIIIFEMPWVLSAAFKVIKSLLPAKAVSKMKFLNRANLKDYVPLEEALVQWGGKNEYQFKFEPEIDNSSPDSTPRRVTFADGDGQHSLGEMLRLNPNDTIVFKTEGDEIVGTFVLTNMDQGSVSFKIRTNSPEKFRVRPSSGVLTKGASQTVTIVVQAGFQTRSLAKDRFLILCVQIPKATLTPAEISEIWQQSTGSKVDEYRLKCSYPEKDRNGGILSGMSESDKLMSSVNSSVKDLQRHVMTVKDQVETLKYLQYLTLFLLAVSTSLAAYFYKTNSLGSDEK